MKAGWQEKKLGELCEVFADGDWVESKDQSPDGIRLIQTGNVGQGVFKDRGEKARYISEATFQRLRCTEIFEGDCLVSRLPDPAGRSCLLPNTGERMITAVDCTIVRFKRDKLIPEFFNYYSQSCEYLKGVDSETTGTTRKRISRSKLGDVVIPIPPLPEQQRIVGILDEAFADIATAKANAEKNLQNARALFESHLQSVFTRRGEGWVEKRLGDVCDFKGGGTPSKAIDRYWQGKIPWVSPKDMKFEIVSDSIDHISIEAIKDSATSLIPTGAVLMVVRSGILARIVPIAITGCELTINQDLKALCPKSIIDSRFLFCLLESKMSELLSMVSRGATVHRLITDQIRSIELCLPPKTEQKNIVSRIDALRSETQHLESIYQQKLAVLDALKKSLLNQAFTGQL